MTVTGPTARSVWRGNRAALAVACLLVAALTLLAVVAGTGKAGALDPDAYDPAGAHALAQLLRDRGVTVTRTDDLPSTSAAAGDATTVFVPLPQLLSDDEIAALPGLPGRLVVAGAGPRTLEALGLKVSLSGGTSPEVLDPGCDLTLARNAGRARVGGFSYKPHEAGATGCYDTSLLSLPSDQTILIGDVEGLTNARLDEDGNAALGIGLLGSTGTVVWLVPSADRDLLGTRPVTSPNELLPSWVGYGVLQVAVAMVVLALWRARRLGRVVPEPLPVVVRAAETVEGRGRLYRVAHSRAVAADALRSGARDRLSRRVHGGAAPAREALVSLVSGRTGRPATDVDALLYGPPPGDDAALVRLADDLDVLILEVAGS